MTDVLITDPSSLTTQQLWREISSLKEFFTARITAIEKGIDVAHDDLVRVPTEVQKQIGGLRELVEARLKAERELTDATFHDIEHQFEQLKELRLEQKTDSSQAISAALQATKELYAEQAKNSASMMARNESSTDKRIEQTMELLRQQGKAFEESVRTLKERMDRSEGRNEGAAINTTAQDKSRHLIIALIGLVLGSLIGVGGLLIAFRG